MRVDDDRVRHVREPIAGEQHVARPLDVFANRRRAKRMLLPDRSPDARADVVERAAVEPCHRRQRRELGAGRGEPFAALGRRRKPPREIVARDARSHRLAAADARTCRPATNPPRAARVSAASQCPTRAPRPARAGRRVRRARRLDAEIAREAVVERRRRESSISADAGGPQQFDVPSVDPESIATTSNGTSMRWRAMPSSSAGQRRGAVARRHDDRDGRRGHVAG